MLFLEQGFELEPFQREFAGELSCRHEVAGDERARVVALVTGAAPVGPAQIAPYPGLTTVLTCSVGTDHLDIEALRGRGLTIHTTPAYCAEEVADHALACVLGGWRGLWTLGAEVRAGRWEPLSMLRRVDRQRLGIVGLGRIGSALARRALALGIDVVGHDPFASAPPGVTMLASLDELLATSDAISLHLPGTPGAPPLLGAREIAVVKPGAVLVNLARASLVDLDAVLAALAAGALAAVAWDVWPQEPPLPGDERLQAPGLLVTPHVAWSSPQADEAWLHEAFDALRASLIASGEPAGVAR